MSASAPRGYIGLTTELAYSEDDGTTFTPIMRLSEIGDFSFGEADEVDVTGYDTVGNTREKIKGLADAGEVEVTGIWTGDDSQLFLLTSNDVLPWKMTLPTNPTTGQPIGEIEFNGYVNAPRVTPQLDDRIEFGATIVISGEPTMTIPTGV